MWYHFGSDTYLTQKGSNNNNNNSTELVDYGNNLVESSPTCHAKAIPINVPTVRVIIS